MPTNLKECCNEPDNGEKTAFNHVGHDCLYCGRRPGDALCTVRPCASEAGGTAPGSCRYDGGFVEIYRSAYLCPGVSGTFLPDGNGGATLDGRGRGNGERGVYSLRHDICGLCHPSCLRFYSSGYRRRASQREDMRCTAGVNHGLRSEPPGDGRYCDYARYSGDDHHRSLRRDRHRTGCTGDRGAQWAGVYATAARQGAGGAGPVQLPVYAGQSRAAGRGERRSDHRLRANDHARAGGSKAAA